MRALAIAAFVLITLAEYRAEGAKLAGKVVLTREFRSALARTEAKRSETDKACYWNEPNGMISVRAPRVNLTNDIAVVIEATDGAGVQPDELSTVKVLTGTMEPKVVAVRPRSTIRFQSVDPFDHELYSPKKEDFRPERQSTGAFRPIEFAKPGIYPVRCKLMPNFEGYVVVSPAAHVVEVRADGTFMINDLPVGKYVIKVFYGGSWIHQQRFGIEDPKRGVLLELRLKPKKAQQKKKKPTPKGDDKPKEQAAKP